MFVTAQPILFVDDDDALREANCQSLALADLDARPFAAATDALKEIDPDFPGIIVSDIRMPVMDGLQFFARVQAIDPEIPFILITGHADIETAVKALRDGAFDFLPKPYAADHLIGIAMRALETRQLVIENRRLRAAAAVDTESPLIGDSPAMVRLRELIGQVARADIDVLIEGETGTGKELVARLLHQQGPRRGRPFIAVNCGALPESLAEAELFGSDPIASSRPQEGRVLASSGGSLFLDEVDSMAPAVQAAMLRVLEEREVLPLGAARPKLVDLRVIAAAKRDLQSEVEAGRFRADLFYRLNVVRLRVPPLRERREDIPQLFAHFIAEAKVQTGEDSFAITDAVRRHLLEHDWLGNVRELRNYAYNAMFNLSPEHADIRPDLGLAQRIERFEAAAIRDALQSAAGDIRATMAVLALPRKTLYDKLARHAIDPKAFRRQSEH